MVEVLQRFGPLPTAPFSRCLECNTELRAVARQAIEQLVPAAVRRHYDCFQACDGCGRVYWQGSHWKRLSQVVDAALDAAGSVQHMNLTTEHTEDAEKKSGQASRLTSVSSASSAVGTRRR
jgi:uncharacterized protein with PIN domain